MGAGQDGGNVTVGHGGLDCGRRGEGWTSDILER